MLLFVGFCGLGFFSSFLLKMFAIITDHALPPGIPSWKTEIKQSSFEFLGLLPKIFSSTSNIL